MKNKIHVTKDAPAPVGPYSQAVEAAGFLYCSGQIPIDPKTNELVMGSIADQTKQVMENVKAVLICAGYDFSNVIKCNIFITDMNDFANVNEVYAQYFQTDPPARACVEVPKLPKGVNVEIEVIAYK